MQSLWLAAVIGVVVAGLGTVFAEPVIGALGGEEAAAGSGSVARQALTYFRVSLLGVPFQLLVFAGTGYLRGLQDTRTPLVVAVVAATRRTS